MITLRFLEFFQEKMLSIPNKCLLYQHLDVKLDYSYVLFDLEAEESLVMNVTRN